MHQGDDAHRKVAADKQGRVLTRTAAQAAMMAAATCASLHRVRWRYCAFI